jgi:ribosomal protein L40E
VKVECSECGHLGPAEKVLQGEDGIEVVCESCGATNALETEEGQASDSGSVDRDLGADERATSDGGDADVPDLEYETPDPSSYGSRELTLDEEEALHRLVPEQGAGIRCPKCAALLPGDVENCERCGLNLDEARHYDEGEAPWQKPPEGLESEHEQAELLWSSYRETGDSDDLAEFVDFIDEHRLYEMAIRRLRFYLVDEPDDEAVHQALGELASGVQSQIVAARAQAEADAEELNEEIRRFKRRVAAGIILGGVILVAIIVSIIW